MTLAPIKTIGDLRAAIAGLDDATPLAPPSMSFALPGPGVYLVRYAPGTVTPARAEIHVERAWPQAVVTTTGGVGGSWSASGSAGGMGHTGPCTPDCGHPGVAGMSGSAGGAGSGAGGTFSGRLVPGYFSNGDKAEPVDVRGTGDQGGTR